MMLGCSCGAGSIANLPGGDWWSSFGVGGSTCSEPRRRGLVGRHCRAHAMLRSTSALLRPETQSIVLKSFNQYPSTLPLMPQQCKKTCRTTLRIGIPADGHHTYKQYVHALIVENYQEHAHARVYSALTYSVLQCPGIMPDFTGDGVWAHLAACASRD